MYLVEKKISGVKGDEFLNTFKLREYIETLPAEKVCYCNEDTFLATLSSFPGDTSERITQHLFWSQSMQNDPRSILVNYERPHTPAN